jgi:AsmA protein
MRFEQLATELAVGAGQLSLRSVKTRLYGGDFAGSFTIDATTEVPTAHLTGQATSLGLEPLLDALLGTGLMSGKGSFDIDLTGRGNTVGEAVQSAAGKLSLDLRDGQIEGVNLDRSLCTAFNAADKAGPPASAPDVTPYSELSGEATVSDGIASTPNLLARTAHFEGTGSGRLRLVDARVDYSLRLTLKSPIPIAGCDRINTQVGNSVPFTLTGSLPDVSIKPDLERYLRERARDEIRQRAGESLLRGLIDR